MTPLSSDPEAAARSKANLIPGAQPPPPGNRRAVRHGASGTLSREDVGPEIQELYEVLSASAPLRDNTGQLPVADEAQVEVCARALHRYRKVALWLDLHGRFDEKTGNEKPAARYELKCEAALTRALDTMGLNPTARARLGLDLAQAAAAAPDLARQLAGHSDA